MSPAEKSKSAIGSVVGCVGPALGLDGDPGGGRRGGVTLEHHGLVGLVAASGRRGRIVAVRLEPQLEDLAGRGGDHVLGRDDGLADRLRAGHGGAAGVAEVDGRPTGRPAPASTCSAAVSDGRRPTGPTAARRQHRRRGSRTTAAATRKWKPPARTGRRRPARRSGGSGRTWEMPASTESRSDGRRGDGGRSRRAAPAVSRSAATSWRQSSHSARCRSKACPLDVVDRVEGVGAGQACGCRS